MSEPSRCEKCGELIGIGNFPFCPHGPVGKGGVIDDTLPGGARYIHNAGPKPVWVSTKSEYKQLLASRGLVQTERKTYSRDDKSPWATQTRLRSGRRDPFVGKA